MLEPDLSQLKTNASRPERETTPDPLARHMNPFAEYEVSELDATEPNVDWFLCANIYVFNDLQEQQECCSCPLTANSLQTSSVINNLISNPANVHESMEAGVIKIVGSAGACSNSPTATTAAGPFIQQQGLHAWINHTETMASNQFTFTPSFGFITSTSVEKCANAVPDSGELAHLQEGCAAINNANSHFSQAIGICKCGFGD